MTVMAVTNAPMIGDAASAYGFPWAAGLLYPGRVVPATRKCLLSTQSRTFPFLSMGSLCVRRSGSSPQGDGSCGERCTSCGRPQTRDSAHNTGISQLTALEHLLRGTPYSPSNAEQCRAIVDRSEQSIVGSSGQASSDWAARGPAGRGCRRYEEQTSLQTHGRDLTSSIFFFAFSFAFSFARARMPAARGGRPPPEASVAVTGSRSG